MFSIQGNLPAVHTAICAHMLANSPDTCSCGALTRPVVLLKDAEDAVALATAQHAINANVVKSMRHALAEITNGLIAFGMPADCPMMKRGLVAIKNAEAMLKATKSDDLLHLAAREVESVKIKPHVKTYTVGNVDFEMDRLAERIRNLKVTS